MAAGVLDRVPVDQINERAAAMRPGRAAQAIIGGFFRALGWLSAIVFVVAWKGITWCCAAVLDGWESANGPSKRQRIAQLEATVEAQQMQLSRFSG